jgi:hypothetical protein
MSIVRLEKFRQCGVPASDSAEGLRISVEGYEYANRTIGRRPHLVAISRALSTGILKYTRDSSSTMGEGRSGSTVATQAPTLPEVLQHNAPIVSRALGAGWHQELT